MRGRRHGSSAARRERNPRQTLAPVTSIRVARPSTGFLAKFKAIGPGMMAGLADNDPAGVATYAIVGATTGYRFLWLLILATFMVQAVQVTSARVGGVTQQGVLGLTRQRYGWKVAAVVAVIGVLANEATLIADVSALGVSLQILTGISWRWFVLPTCLALLSITIFFNFRHLRVYFLAVGLLLLAYVIAAFWVHPAWDDALHGTFVPTLPTSSRELVVMIALLGTTVSPYLLFWEAEGEREARRDRRHFSSAILDVTSGFVVSNLVSYFIVVTTAATIFASRQSINTATDAAMALRPIAGDVARIVFAVGLLGTGLLAVPMFSISIGYIVAEVFDWPSGLSHSAREAPRFYAVLSVAFLSGAGAALIGVDPIVAMFDSQVLDGVLMPFLIGIVALLANDRSVMGRDHSTTYYNLWLVISILVMGGSTIWWLAGILHF